MVRSRDPNSEVGTVTSNVWGYKGHGSLESLGILAHLLRMVSWNLNDHPAFRETVIGHPNRSSSENMTRMMPIGNHLAGMF